MDELSLSYHVLFHIILVVKLFFSIKYCVLVCDGCLMQCMPAWPGKGLFLAALLTLVLHLTGSQIIQHSSL